MPRLIYHGWLPVDANTLHWLFRGYGSSHTDSHPAFPVTVRPLQYRPDWIPQRVPVMIPVRCLLLLPDVSFPVGLHLRTFPVPDGVGGWR